MTNNNKKYGLAKEREVKRLLSADEELLSIERTRGSFGGFDVTAYYRRYCRKISVKSVRVKNWSSAAEIKKLSNITVPYYCKKELWIWWSPRKDRKKAGWEIITIDMIGEMK